MSIVRGALSTVSFVAYDATTGAPFTTFIDWDADPNAMCHVLHAEWMFRPTINKPILAQGNQYEPSPVYTLQLTGDETNYAVVHVWIRHPSIKDVHLSFPTITNGVTAPVIGKVLDPAEYNNSFSMPTATSFVVDLQDFDNDHYKDCLLMFIEDPFIYGQVKKILSQPLGYPNHPGTRITVKDGFTRAPAVNSRFLIVNS